MASKKESAKKEISFCRRLSRAWALFIVKGSVLAILAVGLFYNLLILWNFKKDTTAITNAAFAIAATLAALCFALARSLDKNDAHKDRFVYCGERFFHAAILLITGSVLKYAGMYLQSLDLENPIAFGVEILTPTLGLFVTCAFFWALVFAHTGIQFSTELLWSRCQRDAKDWDRII